MIIVLSGATKGLGSFLAEEYLKKGDVVYALNQYSSPSEKRLRSAYKNTFFPVRCDVSREKNVKRAYRHIFERTKNIDILINNAAVYMEKPYDVVEEFDLDIIMKTFTVNAVGALTVTKYFHPLVLAGTGRVIVNISSEAGSLSQCWRNREYGYCMSKAALNMQSMILQNKFADTVKVLAIHPGWMRTDMGGSDAQLDPKDMAGSIIAAIAKNSHYGDPVYIDYTGAPMQW